MRSVGIRELGRNPSAVIQDALDSAEPIVITSHGKPTVAIVPLPQEALNSAVSKSIADASNSLLLTVERRLGEGPFFVPTTMAHNKIARRPKSLKLPLHLQWSHDITYDMSNANTRARVYEIVLREGNEIDIKKYIDFADLKKLWSKMFLPRRLKAAWQDAYPELGK